MRNVARVPIVATACVVVAVFLVFGAALPLAAAPDLSLTTLDQVRVGLSDVVEIDGTALDPSAPDAGIIKIANDVATEMLGVVASSRTYRARAFVVADDPPRDVVVVVVPGGTFPFDGPPGADVPQARLTGVVIDAATGEFLMGFIR